MSLGPDKSTCATKLREAMRAQLDKLDPPAGANVDNDQVRPNFDALGEGVYQILTADAETVSAAAHDPVFWAFLGGIRAEIEQLRAFDAGLRGAFAAWDPTVPASGTALKVSIAGLLVPGSWPNTPVRVNG